jgi:hypothetical protein
MTTGSSDSSPENPRRLQKTFTSRNAAKKIAIHCRNLARSSAGVRTTNNGLRR